MAYPDCPSGVCGGQSSGEGLKAIQLPGGRLWIAGNVRS